MKTNFLLTIVLTLLTVGATAQNIDFDFPGRNTSEVTEPNFIPWPVARVSSESKTLDGGVKLTVSGGEGASAVGSQWNKQTVQGGLRLVGDGVIACNLENGNIVKVNGSPTAVVLTIEDMSPGRHSVLAYHCNNDKNQTLPSIKVEVDGVVRQTGVTYTSNAEGLKMSDVGRSYVEFDVTAGNPVVIRYISVPESGKSYSTTSVMVNGLEFDTNPYGIQDEQPANHDYHASAEDGTIQFSWKGPENAASYKLVYGTDSATVSNAASYQYKGSAASATLSGFSPLVRYWWRVDVTDADGTVHKGKALTFQPRRDAFPGAEGYGRYAIGGRGGMVYHVTSLADDGSEGTLRYGIEQLKGQPRTIVFDVAGTITLNSRLTVSDKFVTISGQTAPGRGILLRGKSFGMQSDGITRFMRLYLGGADDWNDSMGGNPNTSDGMGMTGNDHSIMDHCSIAWTIDEGFSSRNAKTMTLQHTMISEALNYAGHATQYDRQGHHVSHGYAATIGGGEMSSLVGSYHHNLLAHCEGRNWSISGGLDGGGNYDGHHDIFNNVVYNWGGRASDGGTHELNFVGNYYKMGPATTQKYILSHDFEGVGKGTQRAYVSGNIREELNGTKTQDKLNTTYRYTTSGGQVMDWQPWSQEPFFPNLATVETAEAAYKNVLSDVGCSMPEMLNHDQRIVNETLTGTTSTVGRYTKKKGLPDCESDAGGYQSLDIVEASRPAGWDTDGDGIPDWFEELTGTNASAANNNDDRDGDQYTDLEEYLNWVAVPNFVIDGESLTIDDLRRYFAGYSSPLFNLESPEGVSANVDADGKLHITLSASAPKLITVMVKAEEDGISLTRPFHFANGAGSTGIVELRNETQPAADYFTISGQRTVKPIKGIVIQKGRKYVAR
jgi:hypothetical protein